MILLFLFYFHKTEASAAFPCPTQNCWSYINGECVAKAACASITCGNNKMTVTIHEDLEFSRAQITPTPPLVQVTLGGSTVSGYTIECDLFACGITHAIAQNVLTFTLALQSAAAVSTVGGVQLLTSSVVGHGQFHCSYPMTVDLSSNSYDVLTPAFVPTNPSTSWTGASGSTLADYFGLTFNDNAGTTGLNSPGNTQVGSSITAVIKADFPSTSGLTFDLERCRVQTGAGDIVDIVEQGCYSAALDAQVTGFAAASQELTMSFSAFTSVGTFTQEDQDFTFTIRICDTTCTQPTTCPTGGNADSYQYQVPPTNIFP